MITNFNAKALVSSIQEVIQVTHEIAKLEIFNYQEFTGLVEKIEELKSKIPNDDQPKEERNKFAESIRNTLLEAFKFTPEMITLSREEMDKLDKTYLYANKLIIDCKKSAIGETSPFWWQKIEERMLKPNL